MTKKRRVFLLTIVFISFLLSLQGVHASTHYIEESFGQLGYAIGDIIGFVTTALLGEPFYGGAASIQNDAVFLKFLLFTLLFIVLNLVLKKNAFFKDRIIRFIITFCVAVLSIRFLPRSMLEMAAAPYYIFIIAFFALSVPVWLFFALHKGTVLHSPARRAVFFLLAVIYLVFWNMNANLSLENTYWIYPVGIAFCLIAALFDRTLRRRLT